MSDPIDPGRRSGERGVTLLEAMISLSILLVGLLGLMRLQIYGIVTNGGARMHTVAVQLGRELASGLERLPATDARLSGAVGTGGAPPTVFGYLLTGGSVGSGAHVHAFSDAVAEAIPGARLNSAVEQDGAEPAYVRRWSVWDSFVSGSGVATKVIAVSVIYRERGSPRQREVVVYAQVSNRGLFAANVGGYN